MLQWRRTALMILADGKDRGRVGRGRGKVKIAKMRGDWRMWTGDLSLIYQLTRQSDRE
jgi:hypothetical protein